MGFFMGKPKATEMPVVQPTAIAPAVPVAVDSSGDTEIKRAKRRSGYERSVLGEMFDKKEKKTTLG